MSTQNSFNLVFLKYALLVVLFIFLEKIPIQGQTVTPPVGSDITSYIIANDNIILTGGNYTITIPAAAAATPSTNGVGVPGVSPNTVYNPNGYGLYQGPSQFISITLPNNNLNYNVAEYNGSFPSSSTPFFQPGQVFLTYSGTISGNGQINLTNASGNNITNPGVYGPVNLNGQVTGGVLDIVSSQTFTNTNGPIFAISPNTTLALTRNGQQGGLLTSIGTIPFGQAILNNGFFFAADQEAGSTDVLGRPLSPVNPSNSTFVSVIGSGITAFGKNGFASGVTGTQGIGGQGQIIGPNTYQGPITFSNENNPTPFLDLEQGNIGGGSIVNEDIYSTGDTNRIDSFSNTNLLEAPYGNSSSVSISQLNAKFSVIINGSYDSLVPNQGTPTLFPTIVNGNLYADSADTLINGSGNGIVEFTTGSQYLLVPESSQAPRVGSGTYPLSLAQEVAYVSSGVSDNQGCDLDLTGGTILMGDGGQVVMNPDNTNNTFMQGNFTHTRFHDGDFFEFNGGGRGTFAFDYGGTYGFNVGINISQKAQAMDLNGNPIFGVFKYGTGGDPVGNLIVVTPISGVNHLVVTTPTSYQGITDVQPNTILQEGDGTSGTPFGTITSLFDISGNGSILSSTGAPAPGMAAIQTSMGNSMILTAITGPMISADQPFLTQYGVKYQIVDNGMIIMDNTATASAITLSENIAGDLFQNVLLMNELDNIVGTGGLEQSGTLPLTLEGNTLYSGDTVIDSNRTIYIKSSPLGLGYASGLPNSIIHLGNGAIFDVSQGDPSQHIGGIDSTVKTTSITLVPLKLKNVQGQYNPISGATVPAATGDQINTNTSNSGQIYIGDTNVIIGNPLTNTLFDTESSFADLAQYQKGCYFNGNIFPGGDGNNQPIGFINPMASIGGSLTKEGNFKQTLNGIAYYTGKTNIYGGTLAIVPGHALANSEGVFLQSRKILQYTSTPVFEIESPSTEIKDFAGTRETFLKMGSGSSMAFGTGNTTEFDGKILGDQTTELFHCGKGEFVVGGDNLCYYGSITNTSGSIAIGSVHALGRGNVFNYGSLETTFGNHKINVGGDYTQGSSKLKTNAGQLILKLNSSLLRNGLYSSDAACDSLQVGGSISLLEGALLKLTDVNSVPLSKPTTIVIASVGTDSSIIGNFTLSDNMLYLSEGTTFPLGCNFAIIHYGTLPGYRKSITLTLFPIPELKNSITHLASNND